MECAALSMMRGKKIAALSKEIEKEQDVCSYFCLGRNFLIDKLFFLQLFSLLLRFFSLFCFMCFFFVYSYLFDLLVRMLRVISFLHKRNGRREVVRRLRPCFTRPQPADRDRYYKCFLSFFVLCFLFLLFFLICLGFL